MGKRRLLDYRAATKGDEPLAGSTRLKPFGRCQLIQSYILDKTGKSRSRKQVSSHLQRLKKVHKDSPAMLALFSQLPLESHETGATADAQDILGNYSFSTNSLKTGFGPTVNLHSTTTSTDTYAAFSCLSEISSISRASDELNSSMMSDIQSSFVFAQNKISLQQGQMVPPAGSDYPFEFHDRSFFKDSMGGSFQTSPVFSTSAFSMSMRHLASNISVPGRQSDPLPLAHPSCAVCSPRFRSTHHSNPQDGPNFALMDPHHNFPLNPTEQVPHTPFYPRQMVDTETPRKSPDLEYGWIRSHNSDLSCLPLGPPLSGAINRFSEIYLEHPSLADHYTSCPETSINFPECYGSSFESKGLQLARGISHSYALAPSESSVTRMVSAMGVSLPTLVMPEPSEKLTPPLIIKPTPLYPFSCVRAEDSTPEVPSPSPLEQTTVVRDDILT
ncbi:hypothetical protein BU15DRAFT_58599 [Melanogaster broomeanus]|nr:hypothetical protein BU15DRAFT_58599 [Melanogaster broomeanus]